MAEQLCGRGEVGLVGAVRIRIVAVSYNVRGSRSLGRMVVDSSDWV